MKRRILVPGVMFVYILGLAISFQPVGASNNKPARSSANKKLGVDSLVPAGMPVTVNGATATVADGRELSELRYIITNRIKKAIKKITLVAFVLDPSGNIKSAEGWSEELNLKPRENLEVKSILKNAAWDGDRVVLILEQAKTSSDAWEIDLSQEIEVARVYVQTGRNRISDAQYQRNQIRALNVEPEGDSGGGGDICSQRLSQALAACPNGLESFSCDPRSGVFSFRCK